MPEVINPNNCETCDHKKNPDGGHCYMFRETPTEVCMQHTGRQAPILPAGTQRGRFRTPLAFAIAAGLLTAGTSGTLVPLDLGLDGVDKGE
jgi:hypothetical protein